VEPVPHLAKPASFTRLVLLAGGCLLVAAFMGSAAGASAARQASRSRCPHGPVACAAIKHADTGLGISAVGRVRHGSTVRLSFSDGRSVTYTVSGVLRAAVPYDGRHRPQHRLIWTGGTLQIQAEADTCSDASATPLPASGEMAIDPAKESAASLYPGRQMRLFFTARLVSGIPQATACPGTFATSGSVTSPVAVAGTLQGRVPRRTSSSNVSFSAHSPITVGVCQLAGDAHSPCSADPVSASAVAAVSLRLRLHVFKL
jgi:hypothetical protein